MNTTYMFFTFMIAFVPIAIISICMPMLTRRTESFGVSIPSDQYLNADLTQMRKKYVTYSIILAVVIALIMLFASAWTFAFPAALIIYLVVSFLIYLSFHNQMKAYKLKQNWESTRKQTVVIDTTFRSKKLTYSNGWFIIGFLITLSTLVLSLVMYDKIPAKIPMKYDLDGNVTKWVDKSYRTLFLFPVLQCYMLGLFVFINAMIGRAKAIIDPDAPEASIQRNLIFRRRWSGYIIGTGTIMVMMFSFEQLSFIYTINQSIVMGVHLGLVAIIIIGAAILSFTTGQGGSRITLTGKQDSKLINRDDDHHWKLGIFYFNRQDPALFVEKRFGVGWTNNFAHPVSWIILIMIVLIISVIPKLLGA